MKKQIEEYDCTLTREIDRHYGERDPWVIPEEYGEFDDHIMDMFRVIRVGPSHISLIHLFNDEIFDCVFVEEKSVLRNIRRGNVFLMAIIQDADGWRVWQMSPPYS